MKNNIINWGMIGVGNVTQVKSAPSFNKINNSKLVAVASRRPEKAQEFAKNNKIEKWYKDPQELINDPEVNIVYIATPPGSHMEYALQVIEAGKSVYIEKPLALTYSDCLTINKAADIAGVKVYVAYYRRSLDYFLKIKEVVDSGKLGSILSIHADQHFLAQKEDSFPDALPWRVIPEISGGGYFHDMACHALDIIFYLFGDPVSVMGNATNIKGLYEPPDTICSVIKLPRQVLMTGNWSFVIPEGYAKDRVTVVGVNGKLEFSVFSFEDIIVDLNGKVEKISAERPAHIQRPLIQTIVDEMHGQGSCPSTGESAQITSWVMDEICL